jgi:hypothetical protein
MSKSKLVEINTKQTSSSVEGYLETVADEQKRKDSFVLLKLMQQITQEEPKMWGASMIGFGNVRYKSPATGREVDWFKIGFAPRKANLSLHLILDMHQHVDKLSKLGKHKMGVGCLYINKLEDIDLKVLESLIAAAAQKE